MVSSACEDANLDRIDIVQGQNRTRKEWIKRMIADIYWFNLRRSAGSALSAFDNNFENALSHAKRVKS